MIDSLLIKAPLTAIESFKNQKNLVFEYRNFQLCTLLLTQLGLSFYHEQPGFGT